MLVSARFRSYISEKQGDALKGLTALYEEIVKFAAQCACYGALAMCMIGCAGPPTPSKSRMYVTLVVASAFLAIFTMGPSATVLQSNCLSYKIYATCTVPYDGA
jgi:hypothetical protein